MATLYPDVKFVDVPVTNDNANLHQGLGVPSLPLATFTIRRLDRGRAEINPQVLPVYEQSLHSYYTGSCDIPDDEESSSNLLMLLLDSSITFCCYCTQTLNQPYCAKQ
jgi:hypothetical protein